VSSPSPEDEEERDKSGETESFKGTEESEESERSELQYGVDDSPSCVLSVVLAFQVSFIHHSLTDCVCVYIIDALMSNSDDHLTLTVEWMDFAVSIELCQ